DRLPQPPGVLRHTPRGRAARAARPAPAQVHRLCRRDGPLLPRARGRRELLAAALSAAHQTGEQRRRARLDLLAQRQATRLARLLALREHKPWAAMDGEEWVAAFPWEGEPLEAESAELAVAPSLAVELPAPRLPGAKRRRAKVDKPPRFQRATAHNPELLERA